MKANFLVDAVQEQYLKSLLKSFPRSHPSYLGHKYKHKVVKIPDLFLFQVPTSPSEVTISPSVLQVVTPPPKNSPPPPYCYKSPPLMSPSPFPYYYKSPPPPKNPHASILLQVISTTIEVTTSSPMLLQVPTSTKDATSPFILLQVTTTSEVTASSPILFQVPTFIKKSPQAACLYKLPPSPVKSLSPGNTIISHRHLQNARTYATS
ncbi:hypothetical protein RJ639_008887 [Escallonia herrerae]|uniref:Uncharacterized protein n=1 Tax=Escallonia herrerae TaxID=1293975 RepID=A0AA88VS05_9ASTE|nr:hypothetical protein RJ639_008887 [Escallonia herrerae]